MSAHSTTRILTVLVIALSWAVALLVSMALSAPAPRTTTVVDEHATSLVACMRAHPALTLAACELVVGEQEEKQAPPTAPLQAMAA